MNYFLFAAALLISEKTREDHKSVMFAAAVRDDARHGAVGAAVPPLCCLHAPETGQTARSRFRLLLRRGRRIPNASHAFHAFTTPAPRPG